MLDLIIAISENSLQTIKNSYHNYWSKYDNTLEIENIFKIWFYKNNTNNELITCRVYYKINKMAPPDHGSSQYFNVIFYYNTSSNEYIYQYPTENMKLAYYNNCGLTETELSNLIMFYPLLESQISINNIIFSTIPINRKLIYQYAIDVNISKLQQELTQYIDNYSQELKYKNNSLNLNQWSFYPIITCPEQLNRIDTMPLPNFDTLQWDYKDKFKSICIHTYNLLEDIKNKYQLVTEYYDVFYSKLNKYTQLPEHIDKNTTHEGNLENYVSKYNIFRPFMEKYGAVLLHIPIITHPEIFFNIRDLAGKKYTYNLSTGNLYHVRTVDRLHSVINNSNIDRYHILIDAKPSKKLIELIDSKQ